MTAVILAGGKGTRIASLHADIPKPMIPINGLPVLERQLLCLNRQGVRKAVLVTGYLHEAIYQHFGDGSRLGMEITYVVEEQPLGTAGSFYFLQELVKEDFLLLNGDLLFDIDLSRFCECHARTVKQGGLVTILTHPNRHPYDSAIVEVDSDGKVTRWLHREDERRWYNNRVNAGIHLCAPGLFPWLRQQGLLERPERLDLDRGVLRPMIAEGLLYAYDTPEYVKDMGTPERCREVEQDLRLGRVKNLSQVQRAVFLDRDGTINEDVGFLRKEEQFRLIAGAAEAISRLNRLGWLVIVATNQPVIARGEVSLEELDSIHRKMETLLGQEGAFVNAVYYCPHHPDKGFAGERPEYKIECTCRKPKPGMLLQAAERFHIDLSQSWMVGDSERDMQAGKNAGCHTAGLGGCQGERTFENLLEFARFLEEQEPAREGVAE